MSLPDPPSRVSLPDPPLSTLFELLPTSVSFPDPPVAFSITTPFATEIPKVCEAEPEEV